MRPFIFLRGFDGVIIEITFPIHFKHQSVNTPRCGTPVQHCFFITHGLETSDFVLPSTLNPAPKTPRPKPLQLYITSANACNLNL